jgi:hypothetical protein
MLKFSSDGLVGRPVDPADFDNKNKPYFKKMTKEEFWESYNSRDLEKILPIIHQSSSFDFDIQDITQKTSWLEDYEQLFFLWQLKAEAYTSFIKEVFDRFENGESYQALLHEKELEKQRKLDAVKADLTNFTSVNQIPFGEISFEKETETTFRLTLPILPYLFEEHIAENENIVFSPIEISKNDLKNGRIDFKVNQFDESIYLFHSHNPVDLKSIEFEDSSEDFIRMKITLAFLFEFEGNGANQLLDIQTTVVNILK